MMDREKQSHMPLARRYRPNRFAQVMGQDSSVAALKNSLLQNKTSHAYLFSGTRGSGKTTLARLLAAAVNCSQLEPTAECCGNCSSCQAFSRSSHLDIIEIDGASHRGIDDIRQINETVSFQPSIGKFKVFIIDEVHMLTKEAFNALLKTLEEPPPSVKFILATTEIHKVPATILSRCLRFQLRRINPAVIAKLLSEILDKEGVGYETAALYEIATRAEGSLRDSLSLLDQALAFHPQKLELTPLLSMLGATPLEIFESLEKSIQTADAKGALELVETILELGLEVSYFIEQLEEHYTYLLELNCQVMPTLSEAKLNFYQRISSYYTKEHLLFILDLLDKSLQESRQTLNPHLHLKVLLLNLTRRPWQFSLDQALEKLAQLEQKLLVEEKNQLLKSTLEDQPSDNRAKSNFEPFEKGSLKPMKSELQDLQAAPLQVSQPQATCEQKAASKIASSPTTPTQDKANRNQLSLAPPLPPGRYETLIQFAAKELGGHLR